MKKKKRKTVFSDHTKHPDLKKMNGGQLIVEREYLKQIISGIDAGINPGQAIFHSSRLQQIEEILKKKGFIL